MKTPWFRKSLLALSACFWTFAALGDIEPRPIEPLPAELWPLPSPKPKISMQNADVLVKIFCNEKGGIRAEVDCKFEMSCSSYSPGKSAPNKHKVVMHFPVSYMEDIYSYASNVTSFSVSLNGKPIPGVEKQKLGSWSPDETGKERCVSGYWWESDIETPSTSHIEVHYTMTLEEKEGQAAFTYFLRSGAEWDGPIHHEVVKVVVQEGLKAKIVPPTGLTPKIAGNTITWEILDAEPTADVHLMISPDAEKEKVNRAPAYKKSQPASHGQPIQTAQ